MLPLLILLIITPHPVRGCEQRRLRYALYLQEHQPGEDRQTREGPHGRCTEHRGTHRGWGPGKVSALSCLSPCSESITIFFVFWQHFASTYIWHYFHYTVFSLVICVISELHFKAEFLPHTPVLFAEFLHTPSMNNLEALGIIFDL